MLWREKLLVLNKQIHHYGILTLNHHFWPNYQSIITSEKVYPTSQSSPTYLFKTVFAHKQCLICAYFSPDSDEITILLEKEIRRGTYILEESNGLKLKTSNEVFFIY